MSESIVLFLSQIPTVRPSNIDGNCQQIILPIQNLAPSLPLPILRYDGRGKRAFGSSVPRPPTWQPHLLANWPPSCCGSNSVRLLGRPCCFLRFARERVPPP